MINLFNKKLNKNILVNSENAINKAELVQLEGKSYYKFKIKIVNTLNFDTFNHIENLESTNNDFAIENNHLKNERLKAIELNTNLKNFVVNIYNDIIVKNNEIKKLKGNLNNQDVSIESLIKSISLMQEKIIELENPFNNPDKEYRQLNLALNEKDQVIKCLTKNIKSQDERIGKLGSKLNIGGKEIKLLNDRIEKLSLENNILKTELNGTKNDDLKLKDLV
jgi:chromosome segregation ATPase